MMDVRGKRILAGVSILGLLGLLWHQRKASQLSGDPEHRPPRRQAREPGFRGTVSMLKTIAKESRSPEEYARRAEAWASSESKPPSIIMLTTAYRGAKPYKIARLLREAREQREHGSRQRFKRLINQPTDDED